MEEQHRYEDRNAPMTARRKKNSKEVGQSTISTFKSKVTIRPHRLTMRSS